MSHSGEESCGLSNPAFFTYSLDEVASNPHDVGEVSEEKDNLAQSHESIDTLVSSTSLQVPAPSIPYASSSTELLDQIHQDFSPEGDANFSHEGHADFAHERNENSSQDGHADFFRENLTDSSSAIHAEFAPKGDDFLTPVELVGYPKTLRTQHLSLCNHNCETSFTNLCRSFDAPERVHSCLSIPTIESNIQIVVTPEPTEVNCENGVTNMAAVDELSFNELGATPANGSNVSEHDATHAIVQEQPTQALIRAKKESSLAIILQVSLPFILSGLGMVAAGVLLTNFLVNLIL